MSKLKIINTVIFVELGLLLLWILLEGVYTRATFAYLFLFVGYVILFQNIAPARIKGIQSVLAYFTLFFMNTFLLSLIFMEVADYFYSNERTSLTLGLTYKSLIGKGFSLFYASIIFGSFSLILLIINNILRQKN